MVLCDKQKLLKDRNIMKFMLLALETAADFAARKEAPETSPYWASWMAYNQAMTDAGITKVSGSALQPPDATTVVRVKEGKRLVQDGPYAAAKEQLGGYLIIDVPSLDQALEWAARCPAAARGAVEVRPVADVCCGCSPT
jgi:hypothetical protein